MGNHRESDRLRAMTDELVECRHQMPAQNEDAIERLETEVQIFIRVVVMPARWACACRTPMPRRSCDPPGTHGPVRQVDRHDVVAGAPGRLGYAIVPGKDWINSTDSSHSLSAWSGSVAYGM